MTWISQIRLYNEFGPIAVQKKGQSKIYLYSFKVSPIQSILLNGKETTIWKEKNRGTIHIRRRQIFTIVDPYPPTLDSFFTTIRLQIWPIFDPSPHP